MKKRKRYAKVNTSADHGIYGINAKTSKLPVYRTGSDISVKVKAIKS